VSFVITLFTKINEGEEYMKIVRAMKQVSRLQGEIKELKKRMSAALSTMEENDFLEDFHSLKETLYEKINELMTLKTKIMMANINGGKFSTILAMGELKSYISFLKELDPKEGIQESRYSLNSNNSKYKSQLTIASKNSLIEDCQQLINDYTDELDEFNAITDLEEGEVVIKRFNL